MAAHASTNLLPLKNLKSLLRSLGSGSSVDDAILEEVCRGLVLGLSNQLGLARCSGGGGGGGCRLVSSSLLLRSSRCFFLCECVLALSQSAVRGASARKNNQASPELLPHYEPMTPRSCFSLIWLKADRLRGSHKSPHAQGVRGNQDGTAST